MGRVIGDHIPPNKYVSSADSAIKQITASLGVTNNTHVPPLGKLRYFLIRQVVLRGSSASDPFRKPRYSNLPAVETKSCTCHAAVRSWGRC